MYASWILKEAYISKFTGGCAFYEGGSSVFPFSVGLMKGSHEGSIPVRSGNLARTRKWALQEEKVWIKEY